MGALIRAHDWAPSGLGPPAAWPQSLKTSVRLLLGTQHPIFIWWGPRLIQFYNDAYRHSIGPERHPRALGQEGRVCWEEIWPIIGPQIEQVMAGRGATWHENALVPITRHGRREEVYWTYGYSPIDDPEAPAGVGGVLVICNETTETVEAARRLAAERNRVWSNSRDLLAVVGADGIFRAVNPAWTLILGHPQDAVVGRRFDDFIWPDDAAATRHALETAASTADPTDFESRCRHQDGAPRWISWRTTTEEGLVYAYGRDITAEKKAEEELAATQDALRQSQKMEAVGQLTGGLAHDFNNLLTGITGALELMQRRQAIGRLDADSLDRYITTAQGAANRAAALTHRLLAFSRRQTLSPRPTDVNRLIVGMEDLLRRTVGPAIQVEVTPSPGLWPTLVDPAQLDNVLLNLCINARDAMPDGGRLTIETDNRSLDARSARERDLAPGQYISLCVTDTGTGMSPETVSRAFEPFYTTKPLGEGTGLGLSMVYGFARQSGGQIRIYSALGEGTTMCLYLPRYLGTADAGSAAPEDSGFAPLGTQSSVLVVDDEPTVRMLVTEVLHELGFLSIEAADGAAALRILESGTPLEMLITDVGLPGGMNGRQLADAARAASPDLKVLFITGYAEHAVVGDKMLPLGMTVLVKPFTVESLVERIRRMVKLG